MQRREFIWKSAIGLTSIGMTALPARSAIAGRVSYSPKLAGNEDSWTFLGDKNWSQDSQGVIYSPVWNQYVVRKDGNDLTKREDFAFPITGTFGDVDFRLEFQSYYWSVDTVGIVFRAQDSVRYYYVEAGDAGGHYDVRLLVRDATGYRRDVASAIVPYAKPPEGWLDMVSSRKPEVWQKVTPGWTRLRVEAQGDMIRVFMNDSKIVEVNDGTYSAGRVGLLARGPIQLRNLEISGKQAKAVAHWQAILDERPSYIYPWPDPEKQFGDNQTYPGIFRTAEGELVIWMGVTGDPHSPEDTLIVKSRDEGKTWGEPILIRKLPDCGKAGFFYGHKGGRISCLYGPGNGKTKAEGPRVAFSRDGGETWSKPEPLIVSGRPLSEYARGTHIFPYSPIMRISDGTLLQFGYEMDCGPDGKATENENRRDRSLAIRSTDDGETWEGPYYVDKENFDSNECMAVELADGTLVSFARTLRAPSMWQSTSKDKGKTWTRQVASGIGGTSPILLRHSSGILIMGSRGWGISMTTSADNGRTWSRPTIISTMTGMMGMTELKDGRVFIVFHEA